MLINNSTLSRKKAFIKSRFSIILNMNIKLTLVCFLLICSVSLFGQTITTTGTLSALSATYGTASATATTFVASGSNLSGNILVTSPSGFEVSATSATTGYNTSVSLTQTGGTVNNTTIFVRLVATINVGIYGAGSNILLSSNSATTVNVPTVSSTVSVTPLTIKALGVSKTPGTTLTNYSGSTAFIATGLKNGQNAGTVTISYGAGAAAADAPGTYTNQVAPSTLTGGTILAGNYAISYTQGNIVVGTSTITVNGSLGALSTNYGTASATTTFTVSGSNLSNDITITPPTGFEVASSSGGPYANSVVLPASGGGVGTTNNYIRLAATTNVFSNYNGSVLISSPGATSQTRATQASIVNAVAISIKASDAIKSYGTIITGGAGSTDFSLSSGSLKNGNTLSSVSIAYGGGAGATDLTNTYSGTVLPSAAVGSNGFLTTNYSIIYVPGNIIVNKATVNLTLNNLAQTFDGTAKSISASASGASGTSTFNYTYNGSATEPTQAGNYAVTATLVNDNFAGNTSGSLVINKASQTITFLVFDPKDTASPDFEPGATTTSNLGITYTSSNTAVADVYQDASDGNKWKIKINGVGNSDITALQAGNSNYNSSSFLRQLTVNTNVLPISLINYTAKIVNRIVKLEWQTLTETNNRSFIIYRSGDNKVPENIGEIIVSGNSSALKSYSFYDERPLNGNNYYSLVQVDNNGKQTNFSEKVLNFSFSSLGLFSVYPNLTNDKVTVSFEAGNYNLVELLNYNGAILQKRNINKEETTLVLSLLKYPNAGYLIRLSGKSMTIKKVIKL